MISASTYGVSKCYSCSSQACSDPFNPSVAGIANCSDRNSYRSLSIPGDNELESGSNVLFQKFNTALDVNTEYVCIKFFVNGG